MDVVQAQALRLCVGAVRSILMQEVHPSNLVNKLKRLYRQSLYQTVLTICCERATMLDMSPKRLGDSGVQTVRCAQSFWEMCFQELMRPC